MLPCSGEMGVTVFQGSCMERVPSFLAVLPLISRTNDGTVTSLNSAFLSLIFMSYWDVEPIFIIPLIAVG